MTLQYIQIHILLLSLQHQQNVYSIETGNWWGSAAHENCVD
jgi:hypothetical protein